MSSWVSVSWAFAFACWILASLPMITMPSAAVSMMALSLDSFCWSSFALLRAFSLDFFSWLVLLATRISRNWLDFLSSSSRVSILSSIWLKTVVSAPISSL